MKQEFIYKNDINREIGGVVYSNDDRFLTQELEEYVITKELLKPKLLPELFEALSKNKVNSSVWISGYYGSGKSHLLKILSLVLTNKEVNGKKSAAIFTEKAESDFVLQGHIKKATNFGNRTILFNISAKADGYDSSDGFIDRVLMVFLKSLNDSYGYHPTYPEIAEIERQMDINGLFEAFKINYLAHTNISWDTQRIDVAWYLNEFVHVYAQTRNISIEQARDSINQQRTNYKMDIESFAKLVQKHCERDNQRIVFCVDEVGQFIANDIEKMLSLQTIAENLAVQSDGKALIIVTSQDDLDTTIGRFNQNQADTFSKIKARFIYRIALTGANADEVIQKRLLEKKEQGNQLLAKVYEKEKNVISTLFKFSSDSRTYKNYQSIEHFQNTFPFVPYQFNLFQDAITELSKYEVFTGRATSVGERSLIGACHAVAKLMKSEDLDKVVTFSMLFDAIKHDFRSQVYSDIITAERGLLSNLAVDILKVLFLVKYVSSFKANINNIAILLMPKFAVNLADFHKNVQEALNLLESQTYIQRTAGELYEYLTNQEKDIEKAIKTTEIDPIATGELLSSYIFDEILRDAKVKLDNNNQPYEFGKKLDESIIGREKDFYAHFITSANVNVSASNVVMFSIGKPNELIIHLPEDKRLLDDLRLIKRTEKYIQNTNSPALDATKQHLLREKAQQNQERKRTVLNQLKESIGDAKLYLNGSELTDIGSKDPKTKLTQGVQQLIKTIYTNLKMLSVDYTEGDLIKFINTQDDVLFKDPLHEVELEVLNRIQRSKSANERTTTKFLLDHFNARPYGWSQIAVLCIIAKLYKRNKISVKQDSNTLEGRYVLEALQRNNQYSNTIIDLEEDISNTQVSKLKAFYQEYFNEPNLGNEPKEVSRLFKQRLQKEINDLSEIYVQRHRINFLTVLAEPFNRLKALAEKEHPYFFTALNAYEDALLDDKENTLDAVKKFMNGAQKGIFDNLLTYKEGNKANFDYIGKENLDIINNVAESPTPYKGSLMMEAKAAMEGIKNEVSTRQSEEREIGVKALEESRDKLKSFEAFAQLNTLQQHDVCAPFERLIGVLQHEIFIGNIRSKVNDATTHLYQRQLELMTRLANPPKPVEQGSSGSGVGVVAEPTKPRVVYVTKNSIKVNYKKPALETKQDVEDYLAALKKEFFRIIDEDKKISL